MQPRTRVFLYTDDGIRFFGEGPYRLLQGIESCGSLRSSAASMDMAYSKAFTILKRAEDCLGFPLTEKKIGGVGGGGSRLTPQAKEFMKKYEQYRAACYDASRKYFDEFFCTGN